jgi:hypothetical protein
MNARDVSKQRCFNCGWPAQVRENRFSNCVVYWCFNCWRAYEPGRKEQLRREG